MTERDLILLIADACGGSIPGRTIAQKLVYFCGVKLGVETGHDAHYFGPFSDTVESALKLNVIAGDLSETSEIIPDWYGGPDAQKYTYSLTADGAKRAAELKESETVDSAIIAETIARVHEVLPDFRQKTLSAAAKVHLIVTRADDSVSFAQVSELAESLGWKLGVNDIEKTRSVLERLDLVTFEV